MFNFIKYILNKKKEKELEEMNFFIKKLKNTCNLRIPLNKNSISEIKKEANILFDINKENPRFSLFNENFRLFLFKLSNNKELFYEFFNHNFSDSSITKNTFFLVLSNFSILSDKNKKIFLEMIPEEEWLSIKYKYKNNIDTDPFLSPLFIFLVSQFIPNKKEYLNYVNYLFEKNSNMLTNIFENQEKLLENDKNMTAIYFVIKKIFGDYKNLKEENKRKQAEKMLCLILSKINFKKIDNEMALLEQIANMAEHNVFKKELLNNKSIIFSNNECSNFLSKIFISFEKCQTVEEEKDFVQFLNELFKNDEKLVISEILIKEGICLFEDLRKNSKTPVKTVDFLLEKVRNEEANLSLDMFVFFSDKLFAHKMLDKLEGFLEREAGKQEVSVHKIIELMFDALIVEKLNQFFFDDLEIYLSFMKKYNIDINKKMKDKETLEEFFVFHEIFKRSPDLILSKEKMLILKKYSFDPFLKDNKGLSFYDKVNQDNKIIISQIYLKEMSEMEKNQLKLLIGEQKENIKHKKRI